MLSMIRRLAASSSGARLFAALNSSVPIRLACRVAPFDASQTMGVSGHEVHESQTRRR